MFDHKNAPNSGISTCGIVALWGKRGSRFVSSLAHRSEALVNHKGGFTRPLSSFRGHLNRSQAPCATSYLEYQWLFAVIGVQSIYV
jgi:hypothetical protein